jgi:hypothetical protein
MIPTSTRRKRRGSERTPPQRKKKFADTFKPFRKLTFAEEKVNFQSLQGKMNELENQFDRATKDLPHSARDEYMAAFTKTADGYAAVRVWA